MLNANNHCLMVLLQLAAVRWRGRERVEGGDQAAVLCPIKQTVCC